MIVSGLVPAATVSPIGFDRLWRSSRLQAVSVRAASPSARKLTRQREDIKHASRRGLAWQVLDRIGEAQRRRRIPRIELGVDDPAGPASDARDNRDKLPPVRPTIADR